MSLPLSPRESEILTLIGQGLSSREIGERLGISPKTADAHTSHIRLKLGLKNYRQLVIHAVKAGMGGVTL